MKNISRRVFIKGLAVAGVAAAASTVLAGCNTDMIPGVDDDQDTETPEAPVTTITFTDPEDNRNTLTVTAKSFTLGETVLGTGDDAEISFLVDNKLGASVGFTADKITANSTSTAIPTVGASNAYYVVVSAYADGNKFKTVTVKDGGMIMYASQGGTSQGSLFANDKATLGTVTLDAKDIEKTVTVKMSFMKVLDLVANKATSKEIESKEFTFTL